MFSAPSRTAGLRRAQRQVDSQAVTRHDFFPSTTGGEMDAGTSGIRSADLASERVRQNRQMAQSTEGTFSPFGKITESESKDGDSSSIFLPVPVVHSQDLLLGDAGTYQFKMGYGQFMFNLIGITGAGGGRVTAAEAMVNLQTINALLDHSHDVKMEVVEAGCRIDTYANVEDPHGYNRDHAYEGDEYGGGDDEHGDSEMPYGSNNGMKDPYDGKPKAFSTPLEVLSTKDPVMFFNDDEFWQRVVYLGMWHGKGEPDRGQFAEEVLGYSDRGLSAMSSRKSSGPDAKSTVLMRGENKSGTPNIIGNCVRVLMALWLVLSNRSSPALFDDVDKFSPQSQRLAAWASTKLHRPMIATSMLDHHKYKRINDSETMLDYDCMALMRYGGNVAGPGVKTSHIEFVRPAGERQETEKSPLPDMKQREPCFDSGQYELAYGFSKIEDAPCCWLTLRNKPSFYIGKVSFLSSMSKTRPSQRANAMLSLVDNTKLMALSKFEIFLGI